MRTVFFDCETHLISKTRPVPKLVCVQYAFDDDEPTIVLAEEGRALFHSWVNDKQIRLVAHFGFFDASVMYKGNAHASGPFVKAIADGRYRDTIIMGKLHAIEHGWMQQHGTRFSLDALHKLATGTGLEGKHGPDIWRLRYAELDGIDPRLWPQGAIDYAKQDITALRTVYRALDVQKYADEIPQTRKAWDLKCASDWGVRTDPKARADLAAALVPEVEAAKAALSEAGLFRPKPPVFNDAAFEAEVAARCDAFGVPVERTPTGKIKRTARFLGSIGLTDLRVFYEDTGEYTQNMEATRALVEGIFAEPLLTKAGAVSTSRKVLRATANPLLVQLANVGEAKTILSTFIPALTPPILHANHNPLVASGRVSVSQPNLNNMPRRAGVREIITARPGYVFVDADYTQAELCALSQVCLNLFGFSHMAEAIKEGRDLHCQFGAHLLNMSYAEFMAGYKAGDKQCADSRQLAKCANFGMAGGLGAAKFCEFAWDTYQVQLSEADARELKSAWLTAFPEIQLFFNWINKQLQGRDKFTFEQHVSGRLRGGLGYCDGCNTAFQGLTADGAAAAMRIFNDSALYDPTHPAYGSRIIVQIYDQLLIEAPEDRVHAAGELLRKSMLEGMNLYTPDVPAAVTLEAMYKWTKKAKYATDAQGRLMPFDTKPDYSGWDNIGIGDSAGYFVQAECENHRMSISA